jgi:hypothetical protein
MDAVVLVIAVAPGTEETTLLLMEETVSHAEVDITARAVFVVAIVSIRVGVFDIFKPLFVERNDEGLKLSKKSNTTQKIEYDPLRKVPVSQARGLLNAHFLRDLCVAMQGAPVYQSSSPADLPMAGQTKLFLQISSSLPAATSKRAAIREASEPLGLDFESTRSWFRRWDKNGGRRHGNQLFGAQVEEELVGMLECWSLLDRPVTRAVLLRHVTVLRPDKSKWNAAGWYTTFLARHKDRLSPRVLKGLKRERVDTSVLTQTIEFVSWFNDWFKQKGLSTTVLINADETRVRIEGEQQKGKGIESTQRTRHQLSRPQQGTQQRISHSIQLKERWS